MKKKYFFIPQAHKWNATVHKFLKLHKRISELKTNGSASSDLLSRLVAKLEALYRRLEKMQYGVGVKLAGAALSLMFLSATATAQNFSYKNNLMIKGGIQESWTAPVFADVDKDGDLDLFVGTYNGTIVEFVNENGTFVKKGVLQANGADIQVSYIATPAFADLDGDGDLDLFVGEYYGYITEYKNNGDGTFAAGDTLQAGGSNLKVTTWSAPAFIDLDGDGDLDLITGEYSGYILKFQNNNGTFATGDTLMAGGAKIKVGYTSTPTFADIDGDGNLDLYTGEWMGSITKFANDGSGNFATGVKVQADGADIAAGNKVAPTFADLDGDGDLDLIIGEKGGTLLQYTNDGGTFKANGTMTGVGDLKVAKFSHPAFADVDKDGDLDLFAGDYYGNVLLFKNTGDKYLAEGDTVKAGGNNINLSYLSTPTFADIDADSNLDLVVGDFSAGYVIGYINDGSGSFAAGTNLQAAGSDISVKGAAPAFADIDGDGNLDLYVGSQAGYVVFFKNNGTGYDAGDTLLLSTGDTLQASAFSRPAFFDIDNDSDLDLVVGDRYGSIVVYKNNSGAFGTGDTLQADGANIAIVAGFASPTFADLDNNGKVDLYVGNKDGNFMFYENMPGAGFSTLNNDAEVKLYPNPTSNMVTISADDSYTVTIMDLSGKTVFNGQMDSNTMSLDMSQYKAGVYMVRLSNENTVKTIKLVVE